METVSLPTCYKNRVLLIVSDVMYMYVKIRVSHVQYQYFIN